MAYFRKLYSLISPGITKEVIKGFTREFTIFDEGGLMVYVNKLLGNRCQISLYLETIVFCLGFHFCDAFAGMVSSGERPDISTLHGINRCSGWMKHRMEEFNRCFWLLLFMSNSKIIRSESGF